MTPELMLLCIRRCLGAGHIHPKSGVYRPCLDCVVAVVSAEEREACAKIVEEWTPYSNAAADDYKIQRADNAALIRART